MHDEKEPYISGDGVGDLITDVPDEEVAPDTSDAMLVEEDEEDRDDPENDDALENAGSSPEFEHLERRQGHA